MASQPTLLGDMRSRFETFYAGMRDNGASEYDLNRIASAIFYLRTLLIRSGLTGADKTAVEIGCGNGNKSFALAGLFGQYVGIDLNGAQIQEGRKRNTLYGTDGTHFVLANAAEALTSRAAYGIPEKIDVLILYAVIEHLRLDERRVVLGLADSVMAEGGHVLVMESPNRLIPYDSHTTGMHFFNWLPDEMAAQTARVEATRPEIADLMLSWDNPDAATALARAGRGVSYQDFSLSFQNPLETYTFELDSFEVEMLNIEPMTYQDFALFGYLVANVPHLHATAFSRSWLDFLVSRQHQKKRTRRFLSPHYPKWATFDTPPLFYSSVSISLAAGRPDWTCEMTPTHMSDVTLLFTAPGDCGRLTLHANDEALEEIDVGELHQVRPSIWHKGYAVSVHLDREVSSLRVSSAGGLGPIHFQGCVASLR